MNRHNTRILAMMTLYQNDVIEHMKSKDEIELDNIKSLSFFDELDEDEKVEEGTLEVQETLYKRIVKGVLEHKEEIDSNIEKALTNNKYPLDRLSYVDRAIIRIACFEMMYTKTPAPVIINEAVEITKDYVDTDDFKASSFNNKVLDNLKEVVYGTNK